jgi:hypothetical protein
VIDKSENCHGQTLALASRSKHFWLKKLAKWRSEYLGYSKTSVVPAKAGTQSVQVLENTMDWIPAFAGMTNF